MLSAYSKLDDGISTTLLARRKEPKLAWKTDSTTLASYTDCTFPPVLAAKEARQFSLAGHEVTQKELEKNTVCLLASP